MRTGDIVVRVTTSKTDAGIRSVPLSPTMIRTLTRRRSETRYAADSDPIFPSAGVQSSTRATGARGSSIPPPTPPGSPGQPRTSCGTAWPRFWPASITRRLTSRHTSATRMAGCWHSGPTFTRLDSTRRTSSMTPLARRVLTHPLTRRLAEIGESLEPTPGLEPGTPSLRVEVLYQLSYVGKVLVLQGLCDSAPQWTRVRAANSAAPFGNDSLRLCWNAA